MEVKSEIMKTAFRNAGVVTDTTEIARLKIEGNKIGDNIQELQGEELQNFSNDLQKVTDNMKLYEINISNVNAKGNELNDNFKKLFQIADKIQIKNSEILNLQEVLQCISQKEVQTNENLCNHQHINVFAYDKKNSILGLAPEETQYLLDCENYLNVNNLGILISSEDEKKFIKRNIKSIRKSQVTTKKIIDISKDQDISDINLYEIYMNGMVVLIQSPLIIDTIGLNRIPVSNMNDKNSGYILAIDGKSQKIKGQYQINEEEQEDLLKELDEIAQDTSIGEFKLKNISFTPDDKIAPVFKNILSNVSKIEMENVTVPGLKQILNEIENENIESSRLINCGVKLGDLTNPLLQNFVIGDDSEAINKHKTEGKVPWIQKLKDFAKKIPILNRYFNDRLMLPEATTVQNQDNSKQFIDSLKNDIIVPKEIKNGKHAKTKEKEEITIE